MRGDKLFAMILAWVFCMPSYAVDIGNFIARGSMSGQVMISDLNNATFLDVSVEVDGIPVNYVLEQISDEQVLISISDPLLVQLESLIEVSVQSDFSRRTRSFAYRNDSAKQTLNDALQAADLLNQTQKPATKKVIVPANQQIVDDSSPGEFRDGVLHINITKGQTSIGTAVEHLARSQNLNVLILPGDREVYDAVLTGPVTSFDDLYAASDRKVKKVYIDRVNRWVRIVGTDSNSAITDTMFGAEVEDQTSIGQLLKDIAMVNGYTALIYPGDESSLLNTTVSWKGVKGFNDLALLVAENGGQLIIDRANGLIRAKKL